MSLTGIFLHADAPNVSLRTYDDDYDSCITVLFTYMIRDLARCLFEKPCGDSSAFSFSQYTT